MARALRWASNHLFAVGLGGFVVYLGLALLTYALLSTAVMVFAIIPVVLIALAGGRWAGFGGGGLVLAFDLGLILVFPTAGVSPLDAEFILLHLAYLGLGFLIGLQRQRIQALHQAQTQGIARQGGLSFNDPRLATVINQAAVVVVVTDLDGKIVFANPYFEKATGYTVAEVLGENPRIMKSGYQDREFYKQMWGQISSGKTWKGVFINRHKDGSLFHEEATIFPILDEHGKMINYAAVKQNITARVAAERASKEIELRYQALFDRSTDAVFIISLDQKVLAVNAQAVEFLGYTAEGMVGMSVAELVDEDDFVDLGNKGEQILRGEVPALYERRFKHKNGSVVTGEISAAQVFDPEGNPVYIQSVVRDITEKKRAERALMESEFRYQALFNQSNDAVLLIDQEGIILVANDRAVEMHGYLREELVGMPVAMLSAEEEQAETERIHELLLGGERLPVYERTAKRKDGTTFPIEINIAVVRDADGTPQYLQSISRDVSRRKQLEERLRHAAAHDPLTGLPNRTLFNDRLEHALEKAQRTNQKAALLFIDLDDFKLVNDTYGHALGDQLLLMFAERVRAGLRKMDTVARLGGDEFGLLLEYISAPEDVITVVEKMVTNCSEPYMLAGNQLSLNVSAGISIFPDDAEDGKTLLQRADEAMYQAKQQGKNNYLFYSQLKK